MIHAATLLALLLVPTAHAETAGLPLSGRIFTDAYLPTSNPANNAMQEAYASLWLQGDPKLGENTFARFILTGEDFETSLGATGFRPDAREAYLGYANKGWEFRAGKQIIPWGKSDAVNPTDYLSAKDYTFLNPDDEVRRLGAIGASVSWTPSRGDSPLNVTAVWQPVFPQSRLLISPTTIPSNLSGANGTPDLAPRTVTNSETALKASFTGSHWDASLSAFRGWSHMPEFEITGITLTGTTSAPVTQVAVQPTFHKLRALGGDASYTTGKWIFRLESAYGWTENADGTNPLIQPSRFDTVVGIERPLGDDFRVQLQILDRYYPSFQTPELAFGAPLNAPGATPSQIATAQTEIAVAKANAQILGYQDQSRVGGTFRFSYSSEKAGIDAELFVTGNFVGGDYLIRPKCSYAWTDSLRTTIGTDYYGGPDDRPLGALKSYNALFMEAKYSF